MASAVESHNVAAEETANQVNKDNDVSDKIESSNCVDGKRVDNLTGGEAVSGKGDTSIKQLVEAPLPTTNPWSKSKKVDSSRDPKTSKQQFTSIGSCFFSTDSSSRFILYLSENM